MNKNLGDLPNLSKTYCQTFRGARKTDRSVSAQLSEPNRRFICKIFTCQSSFNRRTVRLARYGETASPCRTWDHYWAACCVGVRWMDAGIFTVLVHVRSVTCQQLLADGVNVFNDGSSHMRYFVQWPRFPGKSSGVRPTGCDSAGRTKFTMKSGRNALRTCVSSYIFHSKNYTLCRNTPSANGKLTTPSTVDKVTSPAT